MTRTPTTPHHGGLHDRELERLGRAAGDVLDLSTNVNPHGPHPEVVAAVRTADIHRYPDPTGLRTRRVLAEHEGVDVDRVVLGAGAAGLMWDLARATIAPGDVAVVPRPAFGEYEPALAAAGATVVESATGARTAWVGCPDNPRGVLLTEDEERAWAERVDLAVFDHAFLSLTEAAGRRPLDGTVSLRSITKDHAVPGIRAGWAIAPPEVAARIELGRPPWTTSAPARAALEASVRHEDWVVTCRRRLLADRRMLAADLRALGFDPDPSDTVWLVVPVGDAPAFRERLLRDHGVAVRDCSSFGLPDRVRLRAGPGQERLVEALGGPSTAGAGPRIERRRADLLVLHLGGSLRVLSHAPIGGGAVRAREIAILGLRNADLPADVDADVVLRGRLPDGVVGMATSRDLDRHVVVEREGVLVVATVGLSNRLRVGDPPGGGGGTINLAVRVDRALTDPALVEATAVATQARTLAVREAGLRSTRSTGAASGTGTDCVAVACLDGADPLDYAGMHTDVGSAIGGAVFAAVSRGVRQWIDEQRRAGRSPATCDDPFREDVR